ncbi:MAG: transcriptional regulator [Methylobacteriaceae bacterium]|nr:transcriptional regulator [Methylobacteriaceae bacterium]
MSKAGERLLRAAKEALAYAEGRVDKNQYRVFIPDNIDVKELRRRLHMMQDDFARHFGIKLARLRDWEQGRSAPGSMERAFLKVIQQAPDTVKQVLKVA